MQPPIESPNRARELIRLGIALCLSFGALGWFVSGVDWREVWGVVQGVDQGWVALASLLLLGEFALRAARWQVLLRTVQKGVRWRDLFAAQVIGATANTLLPLRLGELAKPLVASRRTGLRLTTVFATSVMERVYDLFGLVCVLAGMSFFLPDAAEPQSMLVTRLKTYGTLFGLIGLLAMGVFFVLANGNAAARQVFVRIAGILPGPLRRLSVSLYDGFVIGLGNVRDRRGQLLAGLLSIWMWFDGAIAIACLFQAFGMELPFGAACFTTVAIALTVALPQAPGFFGVFHVAIEKTLDLWGQPLVDAKAFAVVFWCVSFLPVTLVGLLAAIREGVGMSLFAELESARKRMREEWTGEAGGGEAAGAASTKGDQV